MQEREKGLFCDGKSMARYVDCEHQDVELMANTDVSKINLTPDKCTTVYICRSKIYFNQINARNK
jgi:hypothetical protein